METARKDIVRDKRRINCPNATHIGYSRYYLKPGDLFSYKEWYTNETFHYRTAKCHGRVKPNDENKYYILAQAVNDLLTFTYERWIDPADVVETTPKDIVNPHIAAFFADREKNMGSSR